MAIIQCKTRDGIAAEWIYSKVINNEYKKAGKRGRIVNQVDSSSEKKVFIIGQ